ncbi:hypothetical protein ACTFIY_003708 [Dictyostelium cf. discoideum]
MNLPLSSLIFSKVNEHGHLQQTTTVTISLSSLCSPSTIARLFQPSLTPTSSSSTPYSSSPIVPSSGSSIPLAGQSILPLLSSSGFYYGNVSGLHRLLNLPSNIYFKNGVNGTCDIIISKCLIGSKEITNEQWNCIKEYLNIKINGCVKINIHHKEVTTTTTTTSTESPNNKMLYMIKIHLSIIYN